MVKKRLYWIDVLKGMGAILVLLGHLVPYNSMIKIYIYSFHVPLFFFISGYVFKYEKKIDYFFYKKVNRLLIPYIKYSILSFFASYFVEDVVASKREILYHIFFVGGTNYFNTSLWFLVILFFTLIIAEIVGLIVNKLKIKTNQLINTLILLCLLVVGLLFIKFNITLPFGIQILPHSLLIFYLGYLYKKSTKLPKLLSKLLKKITIMKYAIIPVGILAIVLGQINGNIAMSMSEYNNYFIYLFVALVNIMIYILIAKKINRQKVLEKLGELSLFMICTQRILIKFIYYFQNKFDLTLLQSPNILIDIGITILILMLYLSYGKAKEVIKMKKKSWILTMLLILISFNITCINAKSTGWEVIDGKYYYYDSQTNAYLTGWQTIDGLKYYFDPTTRVRLQGIHEVDGKKYFFGVTKGKVMYGWINYDNKKYYTDPTTGVLSSGVTKVGSKNYFFGINTNKLMYGLINNHDGEKYYSNKDGVLQTGWQKISGKTYYFDKTTYKAKSGWQTIDNLKYYFDPTTKVRLQGIHEVDGKKYFFGVTKGKVMYGWINYDNKKYYTDPTTGVLSSGVTKVGSKNYFFGINTNKLMYGLINNHDGEKYYSNKDGILQKGWQTVSGKTYYFNTVTYKAVKGWQTINNLNYYFDQTTRVRLQGIHEVDGKKYFFGVNTGKVMYGWINYDNKKYYTDPMSGVLASGVTKVDINSYFFGINTNKLMYGLINNHDGEKYYSNKDGALQTGMLEINSKWYYFDKTNYKALSGIQIIDNAEYYFDPTTKVRAKYITKVDGKYYFYGIKYGKKQYGLISYDGEYYYADPQTGELQTGWVTIDDKLYYYLPDSKKRAKGVHKVDGKYYFFAITTGLVRKGWINYNNKTYYADPQTGVLVTTNTTIDGVYYKFNSNGTIISQWIKDSQGTRYLFANGKYADDWTHIEGGKHFFNSLGYLIDKNARKVIDVSAHNGTIDWDKVKSKGDIDAVILRIAAGCESEDTKLKYNIENLKRLGIPYGVYIYSYAENEREGKLYAQFTKKTLDKYSMNPTYGVYFDLENNGITNYLKASDYDKIVKGFMNYMAGTKYKSVTRIYTYKSFAETKLTSSYTKQFIYWMAQYYHYCTYNGSFKAWQYSSTEKLPGISGNVDMSVWY